MHTRARWQPRAVAPRLTVRAVGALPGCAGALHRSLLSHHLRCLNLQALEALLQGRVVIARVLQVGEQLGVL